MEPIKDIGRRMKWLLRTWAGKDVYYRPQVRVPYTRVGGKPETGFGAWSVCMERLGADSIVYSAGVGDDISFDLDLIRRLGVDILAIDPTPESHTWLARQEVPPQFKLVPYAVGGQDGPVRFYPHANPDYVAHSVVVHDEVVGEPIEVPMRRLKTLMDEHGHTHIDLLKLDIEGAEYDVIDDLVQSGLVVDQLLVEFHHRLEGLGTERTRQAVAALNAYGLRIFHISPRGEEYAFIRPH